MSYKSLSVNGLNLGGRETVSTGVQTESASEPPFGHRNKNQLNIQLEAAATAETSHPSMQTRPSMSSSNFNDGIEWDSSETITPSRTPAHDCAPSVDFQPFQPVSKFNFVLHNNSFKSDAVEPESKLPQPNGFTSLNLSNASKCLSCKNHLDVDKQKFEQLTAENRTLSERCKEFENSLELMRVEYEKTEDYWACKLDEERRLFEEVIFQFFYNYFYQNKSKNHFRF